VDHLLCRACCWECLAPAATLVSLDRHGFGFVHILPEFNTTVVLWWALTNTFCLGKAGILTCWAGCCGDNDDFQSPRGVTMADFFFNGLVVIA
jgi:hypothetical protein